MKRKRRDKTVTGRAGGSLIVTPGRFQNLIALFLFSRSVLFSSFVLSICYSSCIRRRVISRSFRKVLTNKASKDQILKSNSLLLSFSLYFHRSSTVRISPFSFLNGWPNRSKENKFTAPSTKTEEKRGTVKKYLYVRFCFLSPNQIELNKRKVAESKRGFV